MTGRDLLRADLAALINQDPSTLADDTRLAGLLDSLGMLTVAAWLESRGVVIEDDTAHPATVGAVLDLAGLPAFSIRVSADGDPGDPARPPALPRQRSPLEPVVAAGGLALTPVVPADTEFLYWLSVQPETCFRWRYRGTPPPYERFAADLWSRVLVQFVARRAEDGEPVGHVVAYAADSTMRHCYVGAVFVPALAGTGLPAMAVRTLVGYLFHTFPLHKLYLEVPGFNWPQLESGAGTLFEVEGVLREHDYYAGRHWDKRICAIYRDDR